MTTLFMYTKKEVAECLKRAIEKMNQIELCITYKATEPNEKGYVDVKITAIGDYYIFRLGVEMGKFPTYISDYV